MLKNNTRLGMWVKYFDIQKDGKQWVAWYYEEYTTEELNEQIDEIKKGK